MSEWSGSLEESAFLFVFLNHRPISSHPFASSDSPQLTDVCGVGSDTVAHGAIDILSHLARSPRRP